jgi:TPR repeat protein
VVAGATLCALAVTGGTLGWRAVVARRTRDLEQACEQGQRKACDGLCSRAAPRFCDRSGELAKDSDPDGAVAAYGIACDAHGGASCRFLGVLLEKRSKADPAEIRRRFQQGCDAKDAESCGRLALTMLKEGAQGSAVVDRLEQGCSAGLGAACATLGDVFDQGRGVEKSNERAALAYQRACDAGDVLGCIWLARRSKEWNHALTGEATKVYLGWAHRSNPGALADAWQGNEDVFREGLEPAQRADVALEACHRGTLKACVTAARDSLADDGLPLEYVHTAELLKTACDASPDGCIELAQLTEKGLGVHADPARAEQLARRACGDNARQGKRGWSCPHPPRIREGWTNISSIPLSLVAQVLTLQKSSFPPCWEGRDAPPPKGRVTVSYNGPKVSVTFDNTGSVDAVTRKCLVNVLQEAPFPPGGALPDFSISLDIGSP